MNETSLTDWLEGGTRPVHAGVYQRRWPGGPYTCWDGRAWRQDAATPQAAASRETPSATAHAPWRGLATPPDRPCLACKGHGVIDLGWDDERGVDLISECLDCGPTGVSASAA